MSKEKHECDHTQCVKALQNLEKLLKEAREAVAEGERRELELWRILGPKLVHERNILNQLAEEAQGYQ